MPGPILLLELVLCNVGRAFMPFVPIQFLKLGDSFGINCVRRGQEQSGICLVSLLPDVGP